MAHTLWSVAVWLTVGVHVFRVKHGVAATCYMPNGSAQIADYNPCHSFESANSFCCATHKTTLEGNYNLHDNCLPNGLCQSIYNGQYSYYREGCSNSSWPSQYCLTDVCGEGTQIDENGNAIMTPCDNTTTSLTWCCGYNVTDCCGKGAPAEVTLQPTLIGFVSATDIVSSSPTASSTNSTSSASPSSSSQPSSGLSSGAKAGIGVGVALGVVAAIAIAIIAVFSRRRSRARSQTPYEPVHNDSGGYADYKTGIPTEPRANQNDIELDAQGDGDVAEMDDQRAPVELEGNMPEQEVKKPDGIVHTGP